MTATLLRAPVDELTRRRLLTGAGAFGVLTVLPTLAWSQEPGAFPVTVAHKYGSTTIAEKPQRVVTVGYSDHDPVLALGVVPVGLVDWYGDYPFGVWPWAQAALGDGEPEVLAWDTEAFDFERIAAMEPDLLIGMYTHMTEEQHGLLTRIAPTVAQPAEFDDFLAPWQALTRLAGQALGRSARAEEVIAQVEGRFAQARREHPEFEGATAIYSERDEGSFYPRGVREPRVRVLTDLGFVIPDAIAELAGDFGASVSDERMDLLDADVVVWSFFDPQSRADLEANPIYQRLDVVREGRAVFMDTVLSGALTWSSPLSLPFALDRLVPLLAAAVDGDPATVAAS
ncbi:MAG: iron-siderophore ABC transporter substrate-binding protein [Egibacteraceae bacterium]